MPERAPVEDWAGARGERWRSLLGAMEAMLAAVDEPLIHALQLTEPVRIADIGCGGGGTTLAIARLAPAGSSVHGFDLSATLVDAAWARLSGDDRAVAFDVADMGTAPVPERPYDRLVSRFGIMFFDDPPAAFANLARWLAPGGRFAFAAWGRLDENAWMSTVRHVVAEVVDIPPAEPDTPGPFRYGDAGVLIALLQGAGFSQLDVLDWRGELPLGGGLQAAEAATFALSAFSNVFDLLSQAGDAALEKARRLLADRFRAHERAGAVRLGASVHIVSGRR